MKKHLLGFIHHPLVTGSAIIFSGTLLANACNFLFNLFMASKLSVSEYGVLASLISLMTLPAYAASAIVPAVVQFAGKFFAEKDLPAVTSLYRKSGVFLLSIGLLVFIIFIFLLNWIRVFFKITDIYLLLMTDFTIFVGFLLVLNLAILQAKLAFRLVALISIVTAVSKLLFGILLVVAGFSTRGAITAIFISSLIPFMVTFIPIRFIFAVKNSDRNVPTKELLQYGIPSAIGLLGLTSFISVDILLVKHFFDSHTAGMYAGLSLIGRVIFFFTAPIGTVMFPVIVQKYNKNESFLGTFFLSLAFVLLSSLGITLVYIWFPDFVILSFVRRTEYLTIAPLLGKFAFYITIYAVLTVIVNFYLSIRAIKVSIPVIIGAILQIVFISLYHQTIAEVINISLVIIFLLLIVLLLYYPYATKKK